MKVDGGRKCDWAIEDGINIECLQVASTFTFSTEKIG